MSSTVWTNVYSWVPRIKIREFEHTNTENSTSLIYFRHYKYNQTTGLGGRQGVVEKK